MKRTWFYQIAKKPVLSHSFEAVEAGGVEEFLDQLREELVQRTYRPQRARKVEIPKGGGKMRQLSIPGPFAGNARSQRSWAARCSCINTPLPRLRYSGTGWGALRPTAGRATRPMQAMVW